MTVAGSNFRSLVSRIITLVYEHPIIVVPVCIADVASFTAMHLQHALHQPLFNLLLGERSVLSSSRTIALTPQNATRAALLTMPLLWTCYIFTVFLYTGSLLVTASLVRQVEADTSPTLRLAIAHLRLDRTRWTGFIIRMLVTLVAAFLFLWLSTWLLLRPPLMGRFSGRSIGYAIGFALETLVAVSLMEPALRLLAGIPGLDPKPLVHPAVALGLITIGLQILLTIFSDRSLSVVIAKQTNIFGYLVCEAAASLLGALTYLPLFVGLSLLTTRPANDWPPSE